MTRRAQFVAAADRPTVCQPRPAPTPTPTGLRYKTDRVVEPGDIVLNHRTGNCWRVESARLADRLMPHPDYRYVWELVITRFDTDELARHINLAGPGGHRVKIRGVVRMVATAGPWWADFPGGRVLVHPFVRDRKPARVRTLPKGNHR